MKQYKETTNPPNDLFIFIYRIAERLNKQGVTQQTYTRKKAKELFINTFLPSFAFSTINKYSNHIIKQLNK